MKPESAVYMEKAREALAFADHNREFPAQAARSAYYAAFHAAQAVIFELTEKSSKTHNGVRTRFSGLVRDRDDVRVFTTFLAEGYEYKHVADYDISGRTVTAQEAESAIATATRFVDYVTALLPPPSTES